MTVHSRLATAVPVAAVAALLAGAALHLGERPDSAHTLMMVALAVLGLPVVLRTAIGLLRGRFAADVVAALAVSGAVVLQEPVAGLIIVLMQAGGEALERYAAGKASAAVRHLEAMVPRVARRIADAGVEEIDVDAIRVGDRLRIRPGDVLPCDALVLRGNSHVDTAGLTGEPVPRRVAPGVRLSSGSMNQEGALEVRATAAAAESEFARIIELVRTAQASKAPLQRLADRQAIWFTPLTLLLCLATWAATRDPQRVLAVLVIATPCPLLLAAPVAIIGGINRAARAGIVVRSGAALEQLSTIDHVVFDKTGTLTIGRPSVVGVTATGRILAGEAIRLAASLEQVSSHPLARSVVDAAGGDRELPAPASVVETPGRGVAGVVEGRPVAIGSLAYVTALNPAAAAGFAAHNGSLPGLRAYIAIDGAAAAVAEFADHARGDMSEALAELRQYGYLRITLLSGDADANVQQLAQEIGIADARGDLSAEDKVTAIRSFQAADHRVLMVGDGTNDAPALSAATVGLALGGHGRSVAAETADVILLYDDLHLIPRILHLSRRTLAIARQSIWAGLGLSAVGMGAAAVGLIPPAAGALIQEGIDLAVIVNALRAAR